MVLLKYKIVKLIGGLSIIFWLNNVWAVSLAGDNQHTLSFTYKNLSQTTNFCITDQKIINYSVTVTSNEGDFVLKQNGTNSQVHYTLAWSNYPVDNWENLTYNLASSSIYRSSNAVNCGGSYNAALRATLNSIDISKATAGNYSGTLILLITSKF